MANLPSIIARATPDGWEGRYVHGGGHRSFRIPLLLDLYHRAYRHDLQAMAAFLIDDHPAGWSQLGADPTVDTGWAARGSRTIDQAVADKDFRCYCHGARSDPPYRYDHTTTTPDHADWIYVLRPDGIQVLWLTPTGDRFMDGDLIPWDTSSC